MRAAHERTHASMSLPRSAAEIDVGLPHAATAPSGSEPLRKRREDRGEIPAILLAAHGIAENAHHFRRLVLPFANIPFSRGTSPHARLCADCGEAFNGVSWVTARYVIRAVTHDTPCIAAAIPTRSKFESFCCAGWVNSWIMPGLKEDCAKLPLRPRFLLTSSSSLVAQSRQSRRPRFQLLARRWTLPLAA